MIVAPADYKEALKITTDTEDAKISQYALEIDGRLKAFLGYDIEEAEYEELYDGDGCQYLFPRAIPVTTLTKLEVYQGLNTNGTENWLEWVQNVDYTRLIKQDGGLILFIDGNVFPEGYQNIRLTYTAGYTTETLPQDIYGVCKELMILKYKGIDKGNLGQPSTSLGMGSNSTISVELKEDDILKKIEHHRFVRA